MVRRAALGELLSRAVANSELTPAQAPTVLDLIYGSLWYRVIFAVGELDQAWADGIADLIGRTAIADHRRA